MDLRGCVTANLGGIAPSAAMVFGPDCVEEGEGGHGGKQKRGGEGGVALGGGCLSL